MKKRTNLIMFVLLITSMALSACGTPAASTTEAISNQSTDLPAGSVQLNGAGTTFPLPVYTEWAYAYQYVDPSVVVNYQGIGSGGGKKGIVDGTIDFAGSDSLLKDDEYTAGVDLQMYPMLAGAVVNVYNIQWAKEADSLPTLVLDRQTLVDIFNGTVNNWTDPAIVALNPGLDGFLPDAAITVAHRSDGSGTTEIFTKALSAMSSDWNAGGASSIEWPVDKAGNGVGGKGNQGVAAEVINTPNSIGYVELSYAVSNNMPFADMINKAGQTVTANAVSLASAMDDFSGSFDDHLNVTIVDAPGAGSWPICGYTYLILHTSSMTDMVKAQKLLEYIQWTLTDASAGQRAADLGYSVLPSSVRDLVMAKLAEVTVNGETVLK